MKPSKVPKMLVRFQDQLDKGVVRRSFALERQVLGNILKTFRMQAEYESMKRKGHAVHIAFLEAGEPPLSANDLKTLKEASALHRQIAKRLREMGHGRV